MFGWVFTTSCIENTEHTHYPPLFSLQSLAQSHFKYSSLKSSFGRKTQKYFNTFHLAMLWNISTHFPILCWRINFCMSHPTGCSYKLGSPWRIWNIWLTSQHWSELSWIFSKNFIIHYAINTPTNQPESIHLAEQS